MLTLKYLGQFALLWSIYQTGNFFVELTALPVPPAVVGVVLLFALLFLGVVKSAWVEDMADFLLRHLMFFFIPISVGLMDWGGVFHDYGLILLAAVVVSSVLPLLASGFLALRLHRE